MKFVTEYKKALHYKNTTTEKVFDIMNGLSERDAHLEEGRQTFKRFFEFLLDIMTPERAERLIEESVKMYIDARFDRYGMTQYSVEFYMRDIKKG